MLYIQHIVNGTRYTSGYFHLSHINVRVGDMVTQNTVIGGVGGNPGIEWWDGCSTGTHLHLQLAYGLYLTKPWKPDVNNNDVLNNTNYNLQKIVNDDEKYKKQMIEYDHISLSIASHWGPNGYGYVYVEKE